MAMSLQRWAVYLRSKSFHIVLALILLCLFYLVTNSNQEQDSAIGQFERRETFEVVLKDAASDPGPYQFLLTPTQVLKRINKKHCNLDQNSLSVVHMIKTAVRNAERRRAIRGTWGGVRAWHDVRQEVVFVVGVSEDEGDMELLREEEREYGDILQFNMVDSAKAVPHKVIAGMQWAGDNLPANYLYSSADDDVTLHVENTFQYLKNLNSLLDFKETRSTEDVPIVCLYSYQEKDVPARNPTSKWYISYDLWPEETWPPYCRGGMYTIEVGMVRELVRIAHRMPYLHLDDVWITGMMRQKLMKGDANIIPAPYSQRTDAEIHQPVGRDDVIMEHMWGNIEGKPVDVPHSLRQMWLSWNPDKSGYCTTF